MSEQRLACGDTVLRATATGHGPTVLLLHAGGENRQVWAPVAALLAAAGMRSVAYDLRGHGASPGTSTTLRTMADDVPAWVHHEPAPVVVVGASLGGLAATCALADPSTAHRVAGLVLVDVVPPTEPDRVRKWLDERGLRHRRSEQLVEDIFARTTELLASVAAMRLPIVLVRGRRRSPLTDDALAQFKLAKPGVTVIDVPGAGHLVARDAPVELAHHVAASAAPWFTRHGRALAGPGPPAA